MSWIPRHCRTSALKKLRRAKRRRALNNHLACRKTSSRLILKQAQGRSAPEGEWALARDCKRAFKGIVGSLSWRDMARMIIGKRPNYNEPKHNFYPILNARGRERLFNGRMNYRRRLIPASRLIPANVGEMQG